MVKAVKVNTEGPDEIRGVRRVRGVSKAGRLSWLWWRVCEVVVRVGLIVFRWQG
jgi:hypothetical protein